MASKLLTPDTFQLTAKLCPLVMLEGGGVTQLTAGECVPVPLKAMSFGFSSGSLEANRRVALLIPSEVGTNWIVMFCVPPGATLKGPPPLRIANWLASAPTMLVPVTFSVAVPVFPTAKALALALNVVTLP